MCSTDSFHLQNSHFYANVVSLEQKDATMEWICKEFLVLVPILLNNSIDGPIELLRKLKIMKIMTFNSMNDSNVN